MVEYSTVFAEAQRDRQYAKTYESERLILDTVWELDSILRKKGISRAELARKLKKSRAYVSQLLSGPTNMTLRTVAEVFFELGYRIVPKVEELGGWSAEVICPETAIPSNVRYLNAPMQVAPSVSYESQSGAA